MKLNTFNPGFLHYFGVLACTTITQQLTAQTCLVAPNVVFGLTPTAEVRTINTTTGVVGAKLTPAYTGNAPDLANAMGYNAFNGKFYYFKRNVLNAPQEFVSFNPSAPAATAITILGASPVATLINLGCSSSDGAGYYCIDALGKLYYYAIATNSWTTISSNLRDQFNKQLSKIIEPSGGTPTTSSRIYGDMAFDGSGNLWILVSGPSDYGLYKISAPVSKTPVGGSGLVTINQVVAPTTPSPGLKSLGGVAFNPSGQLFIATNAGDNKLFRVENDYSLTFLSTMTVDGAGTDFASCNLPMYVLPVIWKDFTAGRLNSNTVSLSWTVSEENDTEGYIVESSDNRTWKEVGYVQAKSRSGCLSHYSLSLLNESGADRYYRIVKRSKDGNKSYSDQKLIKTTDRPMITLGRQPVTSDLIIETNGFSSHLTGTIEVFDNSGREIVKSNLQSGTNHVDITLLKAGLYYVKVSPSSGESFSGKVIKSN